jgi:hypothetical protein
MDNIVTAPTGGVREWNKWDLGGPLCQDRVSGAWAVVQVNSGVWRLEFCGTHQNVPVLPAGRTPGKALWRGRRELRRLAIPVVH